MAQLTLSQLTTHPHAPEEKALGMLDAPNGIIGLETCVPLVFTYLVQPGHLTVAEAIAKMTAIPANILGINRGTLSIGTVGDVTVINPDLVNQVDVTKSRSKSQNTPFGGRNLRGGRRLHFEMESRSEIAPIGENMKAILTLADGTVFEGEQFGATGETIGEVVFNTSMTGYQEVLTDPSYKGQIVTMTLPVDWQLRL